MAHVCSYVDTPVYCLLKPVIFYILVDFQQELLFDNNTILSVFSITYFDLDIVPRESGIVFYYINLSCII